MKTLLQAARPILADLAATLVFAAVAALTHSPPAAIGIALLIGAGQLAYAGLARKPIGALQWMSLGLVAVFGVASLLTHDPRFVMFKPSLVYAVVGATMLKPGWMTRYMPARAGGLIPQAQVVGWGYAWAALMLATAVLNAGVALAADFATWTRFISLFPLGSKIALFAGQYAVLRTGAQRR